MPGFIGEEIEPVFAEEPALEKRAGAPTCFKWRGREHRVKRVVKEWHEYDRSRLAPGRPPVASHNPLGRGSWGVGRDYYRLLLEDGRLVDIYYDRRPRGSKKGQWVLFREIGTLEA